MRKVDDVNELKVQKKHLVNNTCCENNFFISKISITKHYSTTWELIRLEPIVKYINKPYLYNKKEIFNPLALFC